MGLGSFDDRVPRHLWIVGVLSLLWNSVGAFDYVMTETRNADYLRGFTPEQLAYFTGFPKWVVAAWALAVWGGVAGSLGLLWRKRWAVPIFGLSLAAMAVTFTHNYVLTDGMAVMGGVGALAFTGAIVAVGIVLYFYARGLARRRVLR